MLSSLFGYIVADRQRLSMAVPRECHADPDQVCLVLIDRMGGALANPDSIRIGVV